MLYYHKRDKKQRKQIVTIAKQLTTDVPEIKWKTLLHKESELHYLNKVRSGRDRYHHQACIHPLSNQGTLAGIQYGMEVRQTQRSALFHTVNRTDFSKVNQLMKLYELVPDKQKAVFLQGCQN